MLYVTVVGFHKAFGQQDVQRLAYHFGSRISEDPFGALIE
jgi:hypothetical protein